MDQILGWLVKLLFLVILAPFVICLIWPLVTGLLAVILVWLLVGFALAGLVAGVCAALVLWHRLPPVTRASAGPHASLAGQHRIRRPKGGRGIGEE